jgi:hypothetical protein
MDQGNCWGWWLIAMADFKVSWWKRWRNPEGTLFFFSDFWNFIFATEKLNYHQKIPSVDWFIFPHRFSHLESTQDLWFEFTSVNFLIQPEPNRLQGFSDLLPSSCGTD